MSPFDERGMLFTGNEDVRGNSRETKYATIVADPPWPISWRGSRAIGKKPLAYPTLTIAEIVALPVKDIADDASNLYLWTTNQFLHEALGVARAWGFQYRMLWTWCKNNGIGGHPRNATEHILIASRGETPTLGRHEKATLNWLMVPRGKHSEKPDQFMEMIERFSPAPRIELFARRQRLGWDTWGDEALDHIAFTTESALKRTTPDSDSAGCLPVTQQEEK